MRSVSVRFAAFVLATTVCLLFGSALTAASAAPVTTFSGESPARGAVLTAPVADVFVSAVCSDPILKTGGSCTVDGAARSFVQVNPWGPSGYWQWSLLWDDEAEEDYWDTVWVLMQDTTRAQVFVSGGAPSTDGTHTVSLTLRNSKGTTANDTWQYAVRIPPSIGAPLPAQGSTVATQNPVITVPVSDNSTVATVTATVNGVPVPCSIVAGKIKITPSSPLANDALTTVTVSATDAIGLSTEKTWSFNVQIYAEMSEAALPGCESCHVGKAATHNKGDDCEDCHGKEHGASPSLTHKPADVTFCKPCHVSSITVEHARRTLTCTACHNATARQQVKDAVSSGSTACATCHAPHAEQHANTSAACAGSGCHNGTDLVAVHSTIGCVCHDSEKATVKAAISGHDRACTACHNPMETHGDVHNADPAYSGAVGTPEFSHATGQVEFGSYIVLPCLSCHRTNLLANHGTDYTNCAMCHANGGPRSSFTTWDKTCQTGACHPPENPGSEVPIAPHPQPTVAMDHQLVASGVTPDGYCQSCHGNPQGWKCGSGFGCHVNAVPPATAVDYRAPITTASRVASDPITWKLTSTDIGDGVVATYYSFDGAAFALYGPEQSADGITNPADAVAPFAHTLRYYSVDAAGNIEGVNTSDYNVSDNTAPVVSFNGITGSSSVVATSLAMTVIDPKVNGLNTGVAYVYTEVKTYKTTWGWFPYQAFYQPMASFTYAIDATWDATRSIAPVESYAKAKSSPGFWPTYGGVINDGGGGDGWFEIQYYAKDFTGNQTPMTYMKLYVDNTAPVTTVASAGTYRWRLNASDSIAGVGSTYYSFDGAPYAVYTAADASTGIVNGTSGGDTAGNHILEYYSVDKLGTTESVKTYSYSR